MRTQIRDSAGRPYNTVRLHLGFNNETLIDAAADMGLMVHPEFSWYHTDKFLEAKSDVWLPNTLEYMRWFIRHYRNHPSITIWNLTNETFWGRTHDDKMKIADRVLQTVRSLDPTRPQAGDGEETWGAVCRSSTFTILKVREHFASNIPTPAT